MISVIIPFLNARDTIERCLKNLIHADNAGTEIIAVDDASDDGSAQVIESRREAAEQAGIQLRLFRLPVRCGPGTARNLGIRQATCDWICFVDADDVVSSSHIRLLTTYTDLPVDFLRTFYVSCATGRIYGPGINLANDTMIEKILNPRDFISPANNRTLVDYSYSWAGLYRRRFLIENKIFFQDLRHAEDRLFTWKLHLLGKAMICVPIASYLYVKTPAGITHSAGLETLDVFGAFEAILKELSSHNDFRLREKCYRQAFAVIDHHLRRLPSDSAVGRAFKYCADRFIAEIDERQLDFVVRRMGRARLARFKIVGKILTGRVPMEPVTLAGRST